MDFERVYGDYAAMVYRIGFLFFRSRAEAEDVVADTFVKLFEKTRDFSEENHLKAWLITVAKNICRNKYRSNKIILPLSNQIPYEENGAVMSELYKLEPNERVAVYLFYYERYRTKEIARMLNTTDAAVRARLKRARAKLKRLLEE